VASPGGDEEGAAVLRRYNGNEWWLRSAPVSWRLPTGFVLLGPLFLFLGFVSQFSCYVRQRPVHFLVLTLPTSLNQKKNRSEDRPLLIKLSSGNL
jgi:hypothetical protein